MDELFLNIQMIVTEAFVHPNVSALEFRRYY